MLPLVHAHTQHSRPSIIGVLNEFFEHRYTGRIMGQNFANSDSEIDFLAASKQSDERRRQWRKRHLTRSHRRNPNPFATPRFKRLRSSLQIMHATASSTQASLWIQAIGYAGNRIGTAPGSSSAAAHFRSFARLGRGATLVMISQKLEPNFGGSLNFERVDISLVFTTDF